MSMPEARSAVREAWMAWWSMVRPETGHIAFAIPWSTTTLGVPSRRESVFALDGVQRTEWLGFDPLQGLVHATCPWDPVRDPRPLPPGGGWTPCDENFFDRPHVLVSEDGGSPNTGHLYGMLPLPRSVSVEFDSRTHVAHFELSILQCLPLWDFVRAMGIPPHSVQLAQGFDPEIMSHGIYRSADCGSALLWLAGNGAPEGVPAEVARHRRLQAITAMPCFSSPITSSHDVRLCIDRGEELVPMLSRHLGRAESTVRILAAASARAGDSALAAMRGMAEDPYRMDMLEAVPRAVLRDLAYALDENGWGQMINMAFSAGREGTSPALACLGASLRPGPDRSWSWLNGSGRRWHHLRDVAEEFGRDVVWPARAALGGSLSRSSHEADRDRDLAVNMLSAIGAHRLARVLDDHMAGVLRRAAEVRSRHGDKLASWPVPAPPTTSSSGRVLRFLSSAAELAYEGFHMRHCVGDYAGACMDGRCAIMSIGRWDDDASDRWMPSSTVELRRDRRGGIVADQHRGPSNALPPARDASALAEWMARLQRGEIAFDDDVLPLISRSSSIAHRLGTDWDTPEAHAARWLRWRRILGVRQRSAADFIAHAVDTVLPDGMDGSTVRDIRAAAATVEAYDVLMRERAPALGADRGADRGIMHLRTPV